MEAPRYRVKRRGAKPVNTRGGTTRALGSELQQTYACGMPNSAVVGSINVFTDAT